MSFFCVVGAHNQQAFYMFKWEKKFKKYKGCLLLSYLYGLYMFVNSWDYSSLIKRSSVIICFILNNKSILTHGLGYYCNVSIYWCKNIYKICPRNVSLSDFSASVIEQVSVGATFGRTQNNTFFIFSSNLNFFILRFWNFTAMHHFGTPWLSIGYQYCCHILSLAK